MTDFNQMFIHQPCYTVLIDSISDRRTYAGTNKSENTKHLKIILEWSCSLYIYG